MFDDFQLIALLKTGRGVMTVMRVPLEQDLQIELAEAWSQQYLEFTSVEAKRPFDPGYTLEDDELFSLRPFALPEWLASETRHGVDSLDDITNSDEILDQIRCIAAFVPLEENGTVREAILFQHFSPSHVIRPDKFLFLQGGTYRRTNRPGLSLSNRLSALYIHGQRRSARTLLFRSFHTVNTFLPLAAHYREASDEEISAVLANSLFVAEDSEATVARASQWDRKRFAMLARSGVLETVSATELRRRSAGYQVEVTLQDDKVVFPTEKAAAKRLLQFLNEELFKGAITDELYETNSKTPVHSQ